MSNYIDYPITVDPDTMAQDAIDFLQSKFPGWIPNGGNLDTILIEAIARMGSEGATVASAVPKSIFRYFGANLMRILPIDPSSASSTTTWTMINNQGYTIPAGTNIGVRDTVGNIWPFTTQNDVIVSAGATTANGVSVVAITPGSDSSGLGGASIAVDLIDPLDFVSSVVLEAATTGGTDGETDDEYLNRLVEQLQLMAPRPILPDDFAILAKNIAGVDRALAIDGYDPIAGTFGNARMVAVSALDATGAGVSSPTKTAIQNYLDSLREVNFVVNMIDPSISLIDVSTDVSIVSSFDPLDIQHRILAALELFLDKKNWGLPRTGDVRSWVNQTKLRYLDLANVVHNVQGVDHINSLTFAVHPNTLATTDITLSGVAPLTMWSSISATVS